MRIKKLFSSYENLSHVWASQTQEEGHTDGNRMFFEGESIFSYGHHFKIARFVETQKGNVVLFTDRDYSNTTSRHKYAVRQAVTHMKCFEVPSFDDHNENMSMYLGRITNSLESLPRTYHVTSALTYIRSTINEAKEYLAYFKKSISRDRKAALQKIARKRPLVSDALLEKLQARESQNGERQAKARATREANRTKRGAEQDARWEEIRRKREEKQILDRENLSADLQKWKDGGEVDNQYIYDEPIALRIKDNIIETTHQADVPLIEARKFWNTLQRRENVVGMRLGHYTVDAIDKEILTVGCHKIPVREVVRLARALKWANDDGINLEALR